MRSFLIREFLTRNYALRKIELVPTEITEKRTKSETHYENPNVKSKVLKMYHLIMWLR